MQTNLMDKIRAMNNTELNRALYYLGFGGVCGFEIPNYCQDRNHAQLVLEKIAEMGLRTEFIMSLFNNLMFCDDFDLLTASPRQLCQAALYTVRSAAEVGE